MRHFNEENEGQLKVIKFGKYKNTNEEGMKDNRPVWQRLSALHYNPSLFGTNSKKAKHTTA